MKTFFYAVAAFFMVMSIIHQIFGRTDNAIWLAIMASFWLTIAKGSKYD